jgi:hypothetical protein
LEKIVYELRVSLLTQRLLDQVLPSSSYIYGYPSDTLSCDAIATASCITICCIAFPVLKEVVSSIESWIQCGGVVLTTSSPGQYGTHPCTAVLPRLVQAHHQFARLAPRYEVLVSLMSTWNAVSWYSKIMLSLLRCTDVSAKSPRYLVERPLSCLNQPAMYTSLYQQ